MYKDLMINQQTPWFEIKGDRENRLNYSMEVVRRVTAANYLK